MRLRPSILVIALSQILFSGISLAGTSQPVTIGIVEFVSKGGVPQEQVDSLADRLAEEIGRQGNYRVVGQADVLSLLDLENQKCLADCTDECCFAWIGNAMGARWTITGNISRFGSIHVLNLKLIDVMSAKVAGRVSRRVKGGEKALDAELGATIKELLAKLSEAPKFPIGTTSSCVSACKEAATPHCTDLKCVLRQAANPEGCTLAPATTDTGLNPDDMRLILWKNNPRSFEIR